VPAECGQGKVIKMENLRDITLALIGALVAPFTLLFELVRYIVKLIKKHNGLMSIGSPRTLGTNLSSLQRTYAQDKLIKLKKRLIRL